MRLIVWNELVIIDTMNMEKDQAINLYEEMKLWQKTNY
jgi:hypothetical protein